MAASEKQNIDRVSLHLVKSQIGGGGGPGVVIKILWSKDLIQEQHSS